MIFIIIVVLLLALVGGELEDVLAPHDMHDKFNLGQFIADGDAGKVYGATYRDKGKGSNGSSYHVAIKIVERRGDNEKELEDEIRALMALKECRGVQRFLMAFEHCGQDPSQFPSGDGDSDSEKDTESKDSDRHAESKIQVSNNSACCIWIVTKWVEGKALFRLVEGGRTFDSGEVRAFGRELFRTLQRMHGNGIIHADFDSSNIIVGPGNAPTVVDFGETESVEEGDEAGQDVVGLVLILTEMLTGRQTEFSDGTGIPEKCDYLHSVIEDDHVDESLRGLCKDVCEQCTSSRCTVMDFKSHDYFAQ